MPQFQYLEHTDPILPDPLDVHPELHHYTTFAGLKGIHSSNSLWATSFSNLNDATEVRYMAESLQASIQPHIDKILRKARKNDINLDLIISRAGRPRAYSRQLSNKFISLFDREVTGEGPRHTEPFIISFCSHLTDSDYVRQNGLLSQWRAYGTSDGVAIVFDTKKLWTWVRSDADRFYYFYLFMKDAIYNDGLETFATQFVGFIARLESVISDVAKAEEQGQTAYVARDVLADYFLNACRIKHQAFKEETEVRIIAAMGKPEFVQGEHVDLSCKLVLQRGATIRYIEIQSSDGCNLRDTILRVIVGPATNQGLIREQIEGLVGHETPVICSSTPLIRQ
jgi:hypothetical protein